MVTRPLDLLSKLRPPPASFDAFYFVNAGVIALFFFVFGSRFVISPGIVVKEGAAARDMVLPTAAGGLQRAMATTLVIRLLSREMIITNEGRCNLEEFARWARSRAAAGDKRLLVQADYSVTLEDITEVLNIAGSAGLDVIYAAETSRRSSGSPTRGRL